MHYLRAFSSITTGHNWFVGPLVFGAISVGLVILGLIPFIGILFSLASLAVGVYIQGWIAAVQRKHAHETETGLPEPFDGEYVLGGLRVMVITLLYVLPLLFVGVVGGGLLAVAAGELDRIDRNLPQILAGLFLVGMVLSALLITPVVQIAIARTNLGNDWSGLRVGEVFATFRKVIVESYVGMVIWSIVSFGMMLLGFLMCLVGIWFMQPLVLAMMSIFWVDVVRLAVQRGAPPANLPGPSIESIAQTFQ